MTTAAAGLAGFMYGSKGFVKQPYDWREGYGRKPKTGRPDAEEIKVAISLARRKTTSLWTAKDRAKDIDDIRVGLSTHPKVLAAMR